MDKVKPLPSQEEITTILIAYQIRQQLKDLMWFDDEHPNPLGIQILSMLGNMDMQYKELKDSLPHRSMEELEYLMSIVGVSYFRWSIVKAIEAKKG